MGRRPLVLVVDDEPGLCEVVAEALADEGCEVACATDGEEALRRVDERVPDLVFLDIRMPGLDGWGFLAHCRQRPACARMPVVLLSASRTTETDAWRDGLPVVRAAVEKPFDLDVLLAHVREVIGAAAV